LGAFPALFLVKIHKINAGTAEFMLFRFCLTPRGAPGFQKYINISQEMQNLCIRACFVSFFGACFT
jgi:hypothetical protein